MTTPSMSVTEPHIPASLYAWIFVSAGSWMLSSALSQFIIALCGPLIAAFVQSPANEGGGDMRLGQGLWALFLYLLFSSFLGGIIIGAANGFLQSRFLRAHHVSPRAWITMSLISWSIVHVLDTFRDQWVLRERAYIPAVLLFLTSSVLLSGMFWFVLRRHFSHPGKWVFTGVGGYILATLLTVMRTVILLATNY